MNDKEIDMEKKDIRTQVGKWVNRLHFKTRWRSYINGDMSYADYKEYCFITVNSIRNCMNFESFSKTKFDEAWQYRIMAHEDYNIAKRELQDTICGWW